MADNRYGSPGVTIGDLRSQIILCTRQQTAQIASTGIDEVLLTQTPVYASIQPIGPMTWIAAEQTGTPITHRIFIRWMPGLDSFDVALRVLTQPDLSITTEVYRIRRIAEVGGWQRFLQIEAELEKRQ